MSEETKAGENEVPEEEAAEEKPRKVKGKTEKKKKIEKGVYTHYKVEGDSLARLRPFCERCGPGYFMAEHADRYTCGHCGFTRYKQSQEEL